MQQKVKGISIPCQFRTGKMEGEESKKKKGQKCRLKYSPLRKTGQVPEQCKQGGGREGLRKKANF